jgi:hypothetical protein
VQFHYTPKHASWLGERHEVVVAVDEVELASARSDSA